jgi:hypothetical protein
MTNEKKTEIWTIDELVSLTENVQSKDIEYNGKTVPVQWCELTEAEEPKLSLPDENLNEDEKNQHFAELASVRVLTMVNKANEKNPDGAFLNDDVWTKLPTTLRWRIQNTVLGTGESKENF